MHAKTNGQQNVHNKLHIHGWWSRMNMLVENSNNSRKSGGQSQSTTFGYLAAIFSLSRYPAFFSRDKNEHSNCIWCGPHPPPHLIFVYCRSGGCVHNAYVCVCERLYILAPLNDVYRYDQRPKLRKIGYIVRNAI